MGIPKREDLTGQRFGSLTVISSQETLMTKNKPRPASTCRCDCGNITVVRNNSLKMGMTKSCGCKQEENKKKILKYGQKNVYILNEEYGMGQIRGTDKYFLFDLEDYNKIKDFSWTLNHKYVIAHPYNKDKQEHIYLHKFVLGEQDNIVDHINGDTLDCRKGNLRTVTSQQNAMNHSLSLANTSGVTGVSWKKDKNKWKAYITINGKQIHLGYFNKEDFDKAIKARKQAEIKYFGEYRRNE